MFTVAGPFLAKNVLAGVVAIDISLETISKFLASQSISGRSVSVIYDSMGVVIASSEKTDIFRKINNKVELNNIASLSSNLPALAIAMRKEDNKSKLVLQHSEKGEAGP